MEAYESIMDSTRAPFSILPKPIDEDGIYAMVLIAGVRIDGTGSITMIEGWASDQGKFPIVDELEGDPRFGKIRLRVNEICKQRTSAATGAVVGAPAGPGGPAGSVTAHTPVLSKMAKSCDTDSQKYRKLMQWLQEDYNQHCRAEEGQEDLRGGRLSHRCQCQA